MELSTVTRECTGNGVTGFRLFAFGCLEQEVALWTRGDLVDKRWLCGQEVALWTVKNNYVTMNSSKNRYLDYERKETDINEVSYTRT